MAAQEKKLPLVCHAMHLDPLPLQAAGARYAVCWGGGMPEPEGSLGYLISFTGKRTGYVIGWVRDGGYVYACDDYLTDVPSDAPIISAARWSDNPTAGRLSVCGKAASEERMVSEYRCEKADAYVLVDPVSDVGSYRGRALSLRGLLAVAYLTFYYLPVRVRATDVPGKTMGDVVAAFLDLPPADAVDGLIGEVRSGARTSGFERYAARILGDADPVAFRSFAARHEPTLRRLGSTKLFWIACDLSEVREEEFDTLMAMEGALNRLALIADRARENGADALSATSEAFCADEDWHALRAITDQTASLLKRLAQTENPLLQIYGATGARGGEWDVRTRLTGILECLVLPYRLTYRIAVNAAAGTVTIAAKTPGAQAMPRWVCDAQSAKTGQLAPCADHAEVAASAYALRLAAALATAGFSAGAGVSHVEVRLFEDRAFARPLVVLDVDRQAFIMSLFDEVRKGRFSEQRLTWGVSGLRKLLEPAQLTCSLGPRLGLKPLEGAAADLPDPDPVRTQPVWEDERALTPELAELLRADRVCELDVYHLGEDPFADRLREAIKHAGSNPAEAAQQLSDLLGVMDLVDDGGLDAASDAEAGSASDAARPRRPLYCSSGLARLAMALVEEDTSVRYRYVYDSRFDVLISLANLCTDNNDAEHGLAYARQALDLGPTSPHAYVTAASAESELGEYEQAAELLKDALAYDAEPASYTYTYYRLAYALWRAGEPLAGLACYQRAVVNPRLRDMAQEEMEALMRELGMTEPLDDGRAAEALEQAGVVIAPDDELLALAARALIAAADAGYLNLAYAFGLVLERVVHNDAFATALQSLKPWAGVS